MLHDAAKQGDVEIPVFCYEPKLGEPVGACRMCLVEIEGIPKLQTSCSTPVRDGMVVHTRTDQVKDAQSAVVEFLLVNHPLDCPVCDKGGECPLQDISMGWGPGKSRLTDDKRHFEKPIELSPLVAIDRERCILCYRCVRFSQEVAEDEQLQLLERGDRTFVGTFDDRPYVAPFHGNITDLCPVGALTNYTYRFRARPWDIEQAGSVCTLCPSQCNVSFTVRDEQVKRVIARDNPEVDDGWLCDRGRYGFEMFDAEERVARAARCGGGAEAELGGGDRARPPTALQRGRRRQSAAIVGDASNEEGYLVQRILREALGSPHVDSRPSRGPGRDALVAPRRSPSSRPGSATSTTPTRSSSSAPTRCTARRSSTCASARRSAATAPSWWSPPSARPRSTAAPRRSPATRPARPPPSSPSWPSALGADGTSDGRRRPRRSPRRCATPRTSSIVWGERIGREGDGAVDGAARPRRRARPRRPATAPACSKSPTSTNARGLREAGCLPDAGPGLRRDRRAGQAATEEIRDGARVRRAEGARSSSASTRSATSPTPRPGRAPSPPPTTSSPSRPSRTRPPRWPTSSSRSRPTPRKTAPSPTPTAACSASAPAPRAPATSARTGASSPSSPLALGHDTGIDSQPSAFAALTDAVPFYAGITDADIGGRGIRWQDDPRRRCERAGASAGGAPDAQRGAPPEHSERRRSSPSASGDAGPGRPRPRHLPRPLGRPDHRAEPAAAVPGAAAARRALPRRRRAPRACKHGDEVTVAQNGTSVARQGRDQGAGRPRAPAS